METDFIARQSIVIQASPDRLWECLTNPHLIKQYYFGSTVASDWKVGSRITFSGEWNGRAYEDKGTILQAQTGRLLVYTHFSPLSGLPDLPENYHMVSISLTREGNATHVVLSQDHNPTEEAKAHSEKNWGMVLEGLKRLSEEG